jgi:hypothetical protein
MRKSTNLLQIYAGKHRLINRRLSYAFKLEGIRGNLWAAGNNEHLFLPSAGIGDTELLPGLAHA